LRGEKFFVSFFPEKSDGKNLDLETNVQTSIKQVWETLFPNIWENICFQTLDFYEGKKMGKTTIKMFGNTCSPKWWLNSGLPWYKI